MLIILRVLYLLLIGYLVYTMIKRGGCCGHGHSQKGNSCCDDNDKKNSEKMISDNEKTNSINI
ncbi:hypothetical protein [Sporosalibacterium faouarense]|uniref:hypothetical protein n=1 Tax=Sporosalibacterium faouarense TaxID=516123 RepID=UPI00192C99E2|nr:hypothetical protein [Sporosalibacterium faouarense]